MKMLWETSINLTLSYFSSRLLAPISLSHRTDRQTALTGRFLHITDFHPDPFYTAGSTFESGCHRKPEKKKKKKGKKGKKEVDGLKKDKEDDDEDEELAGRWGTSSS
jgi:endopolyphosphatase